jgi:hypothetical protein
VAVSHRLDNRVQRSAHGLAMRALACHDYIQADLRHPLPANLYAVPGQEEILRIENEAEDAKNALKQHRGRVEKKVRSPAPA